MCLERADGGFSCVALVCVRRHSLIISVPFYLDGPLVIRNGFVI